MPVAGTAPLAVIRMRASVEPGPEIDPTKCPSTLDTDAAIVWNVDPPSRLISTRTVLAPAKLGNQSTTSEAVVYWTPLTRLRTTTGVVGIGAIVKFWKKVRLAGTTPLEVMRRRAALVVGPVTVQL